MRENLASDQRLNAKISDTIRGHICYKENVIGLTRRINMDQSISFLLLLFCSHTVYPQGF